MVRLGAVILVLGACTPIDGPEVDRIEPGAAARGQTVRVDGTGFCGSFAVTGDARCESPPSGAVDFGLRPPIARAEVLSWRGDAISVVVPAGVDSGATTVYVTVDGRSSNGVTFEVLP